MNAARVLILAALLSACAACAARAGTTAPSAVPGKAAIPDALELRFRMVEASLLHEGLHTADLRVRGFLPPAGRAAYPVHIAPHACALIVALGSASLIDLDAAIYTSEGAPLVEDDGASARPSLTLCASNELLTGYLTLHAYQGAGAFVVAQFSRPARPGDDLHTADHDSLSALGQLAQTLHERGFEDAAPRVSMPLGDARPVRLAVNVDAGACYTLAAEGERGLGKLALRLVDAHGEELANGLGVEPPEHALAALQYCANTRADLTLEVVARAGRGTVRVGRFVASQAQLGGTRALWLGEPTPTAEAWAGAKQASQAARSKAPFFRREVALEQGQVRELPPVSARAACTRWDATLMPGLWRATLRFERADATPVTELEAANMRACITVCGARTQRVSLLGRAGFGGVELTATALAAPQAGDGCYACDASKDSRCATSSGDR